MEISPQLMQQLQAVFEAELAEHLETMTGGLLALEHEENTEQQQQILENIFRAAHSLKGAAKGVSQNTIANITHRLESIFNLLKKRQLVRSKPVFDAVLQAIDYIKLLSMSSNIDPTELEELLDKLDNYLGDANTGNDSLSSLLAAEIDHNDVASSDFSSDVTQTTTALPPVSEISEKQSAETPKTTTTASSSASDADINQQASYSVLAQDVTQLSLVAEQLQTSRLQIKQHLHDFQQFCFELDHLTGQLSEYVSYQSFSNQNEKLNHAVIALAHLSVNALNSFNYLRQINTQFQQVSYSLTSAVNTMRLVPFSMLLTPLHRIVRDLSLQQQKKLKFVIEGEEIKIDRNLYKFLHAPLVHLINNAIDHGIETPAKRLAQGKTETALLRLKIIKFGSSVVISLSDDGQGIDLNAIRQKILKLQLLSAQEVKALSNEAVLDFIFKSGFSLAPILTEISGRGVGLDVVRTNLRKIKGSISVQSILKQGTEFILTVPVSLTSESGILIRANKQKFALQGYNIERVADINKDELFYLNGKNLVPLPNGQAVNIYPLTELLGLETPASNQSKRLATVFITDGERKIALIVDHIIGEQDLVIKPFSYPLFNVPFAVGMAVLGNGELLTVLNASDLIETAFASQSSLKMEAESVYGVAKKVLVIDDSTTSRTLEKNILEQQGFQVTALANGLAAWQELQKNAQYDLIVTDVEMPLLNGFELVEKIKNHAATCHIPTIIVSSLNNEQDKRRGVQVGADAYITKDSFDSQRLLTIIYQLL
jgi:two-component system chemotaxis sensor kinase CheA